MKKQNTRDVKAHLLRGAFYLLLFVGLVVVVALSAAINMPNPGSKFSTWQDNIAFVKVRESASSLLASATRNNQTLTFTDRVGYQRAIEEVYWRHRIWAKENPDPKPSLDAVMSQAQLEKKVTDYLRKSQALEDYWQRPITAQQLQAEMDRMATHTKQSEVLQELFDALGNDPFVIAECLARPLLAERSLPEVYAHDRTLSSDSKRPWVGSAKTQVAIKMAAVSRPTYTLPVIAAPAGACTDDTWAATSITNAPAARLGHTAVWTGSEKNIWGGGKSCHHLGNRGGGHTNQH